MTTLDALMSRLRIRQLQLLIALDEHKSMHKAAGVMSMTQSAASKMLGELESIFAAQLFERSKNGMIPNQFGHCVIRHARLLTMDLSALCDDISEIRSGRGGRLAIGSIMGAIPEIVVPVLDELHASQQNLSVEVVEDTSAKMLLQLDEGHLDLVIGRTVVSDQPAKYRYQKIGDEPLSVVVGHAHPPLPENVEIRDLIDHRWVVYPTQMPLRALLEREMDLAGLTMPGNTISTASTFVTVTLLMQNTGLVSVLPTDIASLCARHGMLRILPIRLRSQSQSFGIVTRKGGPISPPAARFIEMLKVRLAAAWPPGE
ncbi:LysR family transcriptional regulator [Paraburkholderia tagetis]|uniref:LysR family transcriptional regulator n=1 Tax=Paraburkholderia tagetis TaxID=2913261 RepID=A0A9X1UDI0_9BURK|nr:LysR family transcriptional regulator [Paraburkholderia tagetis]MCG5072085.1 LysR family transcriptional regulator [Paraburkholderia tagetis]